MSTPQARIGGMPPWVPTAAAVAALLAHLLVGAFLVVPAYALRPAAIAVALTLLWLGALAGLVVGWRRRSLLVLAAPGAAMLVAIGVWTLTAST